MGIDKRKNIIHTEQRMKKRHIVHHRHHKSAIARRGKPAESYLIVVRSWMLLVMFALMLGLGAVVGTFLNAQSQQSTPTVAGAHIEAK